MKLADFVSRLKIPNAKIKTPFLELSLDFNENDKDAAWNLYIELLTRVTSQRIENTGDSKAALSSLYNMFGITRDILKKAGRGCIEFARVATFMLNQVIRPFTAKWHPISLTDNFNFVGTQTEFRKELDDLQQNMRTYMALLAEIAGVEDISEMENEIPKT